MAIEIELKKGMQGTFNKIDFHSPSFKLKASVSPFSAELAVKVSNANVRHRKSQDDDSA